MEPVEQPREPIAPRPYRLHTILAEAQQHQHMEASADDLMSQDDIALLFSRSNEATDDEEPE